MSQLQFLTFKVLFYNEYNDHVLEGLLSPAALHVVRSVPAVGKDRKMQSLILKTIIIIIIVLQHLFLALQF